MSAKSAQAAHRAAQPSAAHRELQREHRRIDPHRLPKSIAAHHAREKFARFLARGLGHECEHRGRNQQIETQKEKHFDRGEGVGHEKEEHLQPPADAPREGIDAERQDINVEGPTQQVVDHLIVRPPDDVDRHDGECRHKDDESGLPPQGAAETIEQFGKKVSECRTHGRNTCEWTTAILSQNYKFYARRPTSSRDSSRRRAFFVLGVALPRGIRCSGGAVAAHAPPCFGHSREPPARTAAGVARGRFDAEKNGRLLGENAGESPKSSLLFSKSPRWRSGGRPRLVAPSPLCAKRWEPGVRNLEAYPPVCSFRRLRCGEIAVLRRGESESPLVRFDAKA